MDFYLYSLLSERQERYEKSYFVRKYSYLIRSMRDWHSKRFFSRNLASLTFKKKGTERHFYKFTMIHNTIIPFNCYEIQLMLLISLNAIYIFEVQKFFSCLLQLEFLLQKK